MVWQPTMRVWAGDEVKVDEKELESDAMEGVESSTVDGGSGDKLGTGGSKSTGSGGSRSQSMSVSIDEED